MPVTFVSFKTSCVCILCFRIYITQFHVFEHVKNCLVSKMATIEQDWHQSLFKYYCFPYSKLKSFWSKCTKSIDMHKMCHIYENHCIYKLINLPCRVAVRFSLIHLCDGLSSRFLKKLKKNIFQISIRFKVIVLYVLDKYAPGETHIMAGISI
jgi:hypothetical protein